MLIRIITFPTSEKFHSQCNVATPCLGMNLDEARNDRWVNYATFWGISVSVAWKYLKIYQDN